MAKEKTKKKTPAPKQVATLTHDEAKRPNIPTAEFESVLAKEQQSPIRVAFERRDPDLDPQLVWRGKDVKDWSDLVVHAPPLFIQEKVHPKVLIDDLRRQTEAARLAAKLAAGENQPIEEQLDLFADFNGLPDPNARTEFYEHDANWTNRMILGDSLQVMASLAEREGLRGQVQCIYLDPPYGIKFNSNFQWSTTTPNVTDGKLDQITREPEQVKAFRDTWRDGIHTYLTYLRDRLTVARDLLSDSGSIFVQIGEHNVHRVRAVMDEVFGSNNYLSQIAFHSTSGSTSDYLSNPKSYAIWYAKQREYVKFRRLHVPRAFSLAEPGAWQFVERGGSLLRMGPFIENGGALSDAGVRIARLADASSQRVGRESGDASAMGFPFSMSGRTYRPPGRRGWRTTEVGMTRAMRAGRLVGGSGTLSLLRFFEEAPYSPLTASWDDTGIAGFASDKVYVVQTNAKVVGRCILMASDPGDLVLDPTCGSGTTAYVAEQWGRRWITIDTSRVALALARARIMGARYPYYLLADSADGVLKEAEVTCTDPPSDLHARRFAESVRHGFVYERVPHITLKSIANNAEIDIIWEKFQKRLEPLREQLNRALGTSREEWQIPRELSKAATGGRAPSKDAVDLHARWWEQRIARQKEIDASIAAKADFEYLYDKPYENKKKVRVAGPFTVESLSPHRTLGVDENDDLIDPAHPRTRSDDEQDFVTTILENLRTAGVQQAHKEDKIEFSSIAPWPGRYICAEARYTESGSEDGAVEKRGGIFIGPEFGTVSRQDLVTAAREAGDANFDVLIACAFNYEAHATEFTKLGRIPVLKARMNADLHMAGDLANTGKGNLFVIFGEPDISILPPEDAPEDADIKDYASIRVRINGVDVFHPSTGEVRSDGAEGIACWFIDTDYNEESFFVRQAYFLGASDPYKSLKTTLKAEINEDAWATLNSDISREFPKPQGGKIAVKVINHLGDEVMKVFRVE